MTRTDRDKRNGRLADRIGAHLRGASGVHRSGVHLADFSAVFEEGADALHAGYTVSAVWKQLHKEGAVRMVYETFRGYCRSAELERQLLSRRYRVTETTDETAELALNYDSVPDEGHPHHLARVLAGQFPAEQGAPHE